MKCKTNNNIILLQICASTNTYALERHNLLDHGTIVITYNQTSGRGKGEHVWESEPDKNLTFSILYHLNIRSLRVVEISDCVLQTVYMVLKKYCDVHIKLPNDIYIGKEKLCGILIENVIKNENIESTVIGIGINVNQTKFMTLHATSLRNVLGYELNCEQILNEIVTAMNNKMKELMFSSCIK